MQFPKTRKEDVVETIHGHEIKDPFRWLEDGKSPEVQDWISKQNEFLWANLDKDIFERVSDELIKTFHTTNYGMPAKRGDRYFFTLRKPEQDQTVLYYKDSLSGEPVTLVDPNEEEGTTSLDFWSPSRSGRYVAYGISHGGDEMSTLYILDIEKNEDLPYDIPHCRFSQIRWLENDNGFYYDRNPRPGTVPEDELHLHMKVYLHILGQNPNADELIFGSDRPKDDMLSLSLSIDGRYLGIQATNNWTHNDVFVYDRETKETKTLVSGIHSRFSIYFSKDEVFLYTNYKANSFRLLASDFSDFLKPIDEWQEIIPEKKEVLEGVWFTKTKMILQYLSNVCSKAEIRDHKGRPLGVLELPEFSTLQGVSTHREHEEFFYCVTSLTLPSIIYRYDQVNDRYDVYAKTENPIDPNDYTVSQEWFASKDSTKIPMFILHRKDLDRVETHPTILYGYGGFASNLIPEFMRAWVISWVSKGGIFAIANIRGGAEFGESWHLAGMKLNKDNTFDDFISAGEYLISEKYTSKEKLGIMGGSNGGLLTAVCSLKRPDLFGAVVSAVPLIDMVRYHKFGIAVRWVNEYGDPEIPEELESILKWSPYHNVKEGVEYPPSLYMTSENDSRVNPLHARKMAAILQGVNNKNPILLYTEMDAGHGSGKPIKKIVENTAIRITFLAQNLGLKL